VKIKYTEHAAPHLRGTTAHVQPALAASLVATGFAVAVPLPKRGSPGWAEARVEHSKANFVGPDSHDVDPNAAQASIDRRFKTEPPDFPFTGKNKK